MVVAADDRGNELWYVQYNFSTENEAKTIPFVWSLVQILRDRRLSCALVSFCTVPCSTVQYRDIKKNRTANTLELNDWTVDERKKVFDRMIEAKNDIFNFGKDHGKKPGDTILLKPT